MCRKLTSKIVYTTSHPKLIRVSASLLGCIVLMCMAKEYCQVRLKVLMKVQQAVVFLLSLSICSSMGNDLAQSPFLALNLTLQFYFKGKRRGEKILKCKPYTVINGRGFQPGIFIFRPTSVLYDTLTQIFEENDNKNISMWLIAVGSAWEPRALSLFV